MPADMLGGGSGALSMLDLAALGALPQAARRSLARGPSGTIVHEAGHFLAAAMFGVPGDLILFDWSPEGRKHAVHIREHHARLLRADLATRLSMLAAGYAAELRVFGEALLNRARSDLEAAAAALGHGGFDLERDARDLADTLRAHDPFAPDDVTAIVDMHNWLASAINAEGGPDGTFAIPYHRLPARFRRRVPFHRRVRSYWMSRDPSYALAVRDKLLDDQVVPGA